MGLILVVVAFAFGVALVIGLYYGSTQVPGMMLRRKLEARIEEVSQGPEEASSPGAKVKALLKTREAGPLPGIDRLFGETERGSALGRWIDQSGVKTTISAVMLAATVAGLVIGFLISMAIRAPWALPIGFVMGFALPFGVLKVKRTRRMRAFEPFQKYGTHGRGQPQQNVTGGKRTGLFGRAQDGCGVAAAVTSPRRLPP